jgi:hypothetical protein
VLKNPRKTKGGAGTYYESLLASPRPCLSEFGGLVEHAPEDQSAMTLSAAQVLERGERMRLFSPLHRTVARAISREKESLNGEFAVLKDQSFAFLDNLS